jgi:type I restriction enzyme M protein
VLGLIFLKYISDSFHERHATLLEEKMPRLAAELHAQFAESAKREEAIKANLKELEYGG